MISCAFQLLLKSMKGCEYAAGWFRNMSHNPKSNRISMFNLIQWWGFNLCEFFKYNLLVNTLPSTTALPRKFRKPQFFCNWWNVIFLLPLAKASLISSFALSIFSCGIDTICVRVSMRRPKNVKETDA